MVHFWESYSKEWGILWYNVYLQVIRDMIFNN